MNTIEDKRKAIAASRAVFGLFMATASFVREVAAASGSTIPLGGHPADALSAVGRAVMGLTDGYETAEDAQLDFMLSVIHRSSESLQPAE